MAIFVSESFTGTDGTDLTAHTGETGATWTSPDGGQFKLDNGAAYLSTGGHLIASGQSTSDDMEITFDFTLESAAGNVAVWFRKHNTAATLTGYMLFIAVNNTTTSNLILYKWTAGAPSGLSSFAFVAGVTGRTYRFLIKCNDTAKDIYLDTGDGRYLRIGTFADNDFTGASYRSVGLWGNSAVTSSTGGRIDNLIAYEGCATLTSDIKDVTPGQTNVSLAVTGVNTAWSGSPFSLISGPSGASLVSQNVTSGTTATLVINAGSVVGDIVIGTTYNQSRLYVTVTDTVIVFDGNSLTSQGNSNASWNRNWADQVKVSIGSRARCINVAESGAAIRSTGSQTSVIDIYYDATKTFKFLMESIGTNDINSAGSNEAGAETAALAYHNHAVAVGWTMIWATMPPRSDGSYSTGFDTARLAFSTYLRTLVSPTHIIEVALNSTIGDYGDELNTTYYLSDKIHWNDVGSDLVYSIAQPIFADLLVVLAVVITDVSGATSGDVSLMGPASASFDAYSSTFKYGDATNVKIEWDFGDPSGHRNTYRGFSAGHFYEHEPVSEETYTVTCTITNVNGQTAFATRTVKIAPNTRTVITTMNWTTNISPGNNMEYRLTPGGNHTMTVGQTTATSTNLLIRSSVPGTKVNIDWTGGAGSALYMSGLNTVLMDVNMQSSNDSHPVTVFFFGANNQSLIRCSYDLVPATQAVNNTGPNIGLLLQQCTLPTSTGGQCIWLGNDLTRRLYTILDTTVTHTGTERPMRGSAIGVTMVGVLANYTSASSSKNCFSTPEARWVWIQDSIFYNDSNGTTLLVGHTSGTGITSDYVIERCLFRNPTTRDSANAIQIAPNISVTQRVVVRNSIIVGGALSLGTAATTKLYNNTIVQSSGVGASFLAWADGLLTALSVSCNIYANDNLTLAGSGATSGVIYVPTTSDLSTEITDMSWNITPVPASNVGFDDIRLLGGSNESWAQFDTRIPTSANNQRKAIRTLDANYRVVNPDSGIFGAMPTDMTQFQEYYDSSSRRGTWVIGAMPTRKVIPQRSKPAIC